MLYKTLLLFSSMTSGKNNASPEEK